MALELGAPILVAIRIIQSDAPLPVVGSLARIQLDHTIPIGK